MDLKKDSRLRDDEGEESDDEWFFDSMKRYKNLHMFDLQYPAKALTWVDSKTICVATRKPVGDELLELSLPAKLLAANKEDEGLCNSRDFHLPSGGFSDKHVVDLKCQSSERLLFCSHEGDNSVSVWCLGTEAKDVIEQVKVLMPPRPDNQTSCLAIHGAHPGKVLMGSSINNLSWIDAMTEVSVNFSEGTCAEELTTNQLVGLEFHDERTFLACSKDGSLSQFDLRCKLQKSASKHIPCEKDDSCVAMCANGDYFKVCVATKKGKLFFTDQRRFHEDVRTLTTGLMTQGSDVCVQFSPTQDNILSLSGYDRNIHIFDMTQENNTEELIPSFTHDGHWRAEGSSKTVDIWTHTWHPDQRNLLLSSDSNGGLHAWEYSTGVS